VKGVLRLVMGDQLSRDLPSLCNLNPARDVVLMVESAEETAYAEHHKKKIAFILASMRAFADELRREGVEVDYVRLDDPDNTGGFSSEIARAVRKWRPEGVALTAANSWRVLAMPRGWEADLGLPVTTHEDDRFYCSNAEFADWAKGRKLLRMEDFYRSMRRRTGLLMNGREPAGGRWNFDADNRKRAKPDLFMPRPRAFPPDEETAAVLDLVEQRFPRNFGRLDDFAFAVTRQQALEALDGFIAEALPKFGDFQDAMLVGEPWLYHAALSPYLNIGLLKPREVCERAEAAYRAGAAPLNAVEGFIRQILGWREYVRGIYWTAGPDYAHSNALAATRRLPGFYWTAKTDMACVAAVVEQTRDQAYAHHIQRLMITGNFALLAGIDPYEVHRWYLAVYADALDWVETPNTIGMSQFADGGMMASKPYAASAAYIHRMSNYCDGCRFHPGHRTEADACPFNYLYWDFIRRHAERFTGNPRVAIMLKAYAAMDEGLKHDMARAAERFLAELDAAPYEAG